VVKNITITSTFQITVNDKTVSATVYYGEAPIVFPTISLTPPGAKVKIAQVIDGRSIESVSAIPCWTVTFDSEGNIFATVPIDQPNGDQLLAVSIKWKLPSPDTSFSVTVPVVTPDFVTYDVIGAIPGSRVVVGTILTPQVSITSITTTSGWELSRDGVNIEALVPIDASPVAYPIDITVTWGVEYPATTKTSFVAVIAPQVVAYENVEGFVGDTVLVGEVTSFKDKVILPVRVTIGDKGTFDGIYNASSGNVSLLLTTAMVGSHVTRITVTFNFATRITVTSTDGSITVSPRNTVVFTPVGSNILLPYVPREVFTMTGNASPVLSARAKRIGVNGEEIDLGAVGFEGTNPVHFNFAYAKNHMVGAVTVIYTIVLSSQLLTFEVEYVAQGTVGFPKDGTKDIFKWSIPSNMVASSVDTKVDPTAIFRVDISDPRFNSIRLDGKWSYVSKTQVSKLTYNGKIKKLVLRPEDDSFTVYSCAGEFCSGVPPKVYFNDPEYPLKSTDYGNMIGYYGGDTIAFNPNVALENGKCVVSIGSPIRTTSKVAVDPLVPEIDWIHLESCKLVKTAKTHLATIDTDVLPKTLDIVVGSEYLDQKDVFFKIVKGKLEVSANLLSIPSGETVITIVANGPQIDAAYARNFDLVDQPEESFTVTKVQCCVEITGVNYGEEVKVKWGDCCSKCIKTVDGKFTATHCYKESGTYTIKVKGETTQKQVVEVKKCRKSKC